ncbi:oligoribonuclease, partial [Phenoliferia sp. Uapishka_3]
MSDSRKNIVWIDCEMTGLAAYLPPPTLPKGQPFLPDRILEIACIVTDGDLNPLDEGVEFIIRTEKAVLDRMNDWCIEQHGKTGLTTSCLESQFTMEEVDKLVASYVTKHCPDGMALLAGNSVHADLAFIKKDLPKLANVLHYRIIDVSSIKELASRWYPSLRLPAKSASAHRALSDIQDSINELKYYRQNIFKGPPQ